MPSLDYEKEKDEFIDFYNRNNSFHKKACYFIRALLNSLLTDSYDIDAITSRIKDRDACLDKFNLKYRANLEIKKIPYSIKDQISDLLGARVVCLYEDDIHDISDTLSKNFCVLSVMDKISLVESTDDQFGYKDLHIDCKLHGVRNKLPGYRKYSDLKFEIQIRSIIQDAWSVLDHKIKYKNNISSMLKRRINRLAALFEIADAEFINVRKEIKIHEEKAQEKVEIGRAHV
jgi:ppGpp synthetase/RelA/SpoT-type nucleotidyltranferase